MAKERLFQKDKMQMRSLTEESTTPEDIAHIDRNANIRTHPKFKYNRSNYSTRYNRCKNNETNSR